MISRTALIIDDEADIRTLISMTLERLKITCFEASSVRDARRLLQERAYNFCITDMKLPDGNGLELINLCQKYYPDMPIAMITAYGNMEIGVSALKAGAFDVIAKPLDNEQLRDIAQDAIALTYKEIKPQTITVVPEERPVETNDLEGYLESIERQAITQALAKTNGNKTAAAANLGVSFRTMRYRCKKLGIE